MIGRIDEVVMMMGRMIMMLMMMITKIGIQSFLDLDILDSS